MTEWALFAAFSVAVLILVALWNHWDEVRKR